MERQLERQKEPEPEMDTYDRGLLLGIEMTRRRQEGKVLLKGEEIPIRQERNGIARRYISHSNAHEIGAPGWDHLSCLHMQTGRRGKHTHRGGGRLLFCLEGRGVTINNDVELHWERGDLELLPVTRTENSHEHFNLDMGKPCRLLVMSFNPFKEAVANETRQVKDAAEFQGPERPEIYRPDNFVPQLAYIEGYKIEFDHQKPANLLDDLFLRRNMWREYMSKARWLVKQKDQPLETNRNGIYRWYIHPSFNDVAMKQILFWVHEIPAGSRSGKQKFQGGRIHFVIEGNGYSIVNDRKYNWGPEDVLLPPVISGGVVVQHFNTDPAHPARLACAEPNWYDIMGLDMACGFEQIEDCPEWESLHRESRA